MGRPEGHLKSPAERALAGDANAYRNERLEEHMTLLTLGARVDGFDPDDSTTILQKVQQITDAMRAGTHIPNFGTPMYEDCKEDAYRPVPIHRTDVDKNRP